MKRDIQMFEAWWQECQSLLVQGIPMKNGDKTMWLPAFEAAVVFCPEAQRNRRLMLRILRAYALLQVLFGNHTLTQKYLSTPRGLFNHHSPIELLQEKTEIPGSSQKLVWILLALVHDTYL